MSLVASETYLGRIIKVFDTAKQVRKPGSSLVIDTTSYWEAFIDYEDVTHQCVFQGIDVSEIIDNYKRLIDRRIALGEDDDTI